MEYSHNTKVFCLIHKMDLIPDDQRDIVIVIYFVNYYNLKSLSFCSWIDIQRSRNLSEKNVPATWMYLFSNFNLGWNIVSSLVRYRLFISAKCWRSWKSITNFCEYNRSWWSIIVWKGYIFGYLLLWTTTSCWYKCKFFLSIKQNLLIEKINSYSDLKKFQT